MKKLMYAVMFLLGLNLTISCGQQHSKNNNSAESQTVENEVVSEGDGDIITEENPTPEVTLTDNDYKWLEGVWAAEDDGYFAKMIITDTYYQITTSNLNNVNDRVEDQRKQEYNIENRHNVFLEEDVFGLNEWIEVDVEHHGLWVILGQYGPYLSLEKIDGQITEEATAQANQPIVKGIHGITDPASYTWVDENLYGKVRSYIEEGKEKETNLGYYVIKEFDNKGQIVYYKTNESSAYGAYPFAVSMSHLFWHLPIEDKINTIGSLTGNCFILDHHLINPAHMVCYKPFSSNHPKDPKRNTHFNGEAIYKYDTHGYITDLYINNKSHYEFEYDNAGHVVKTLENGKPIFKITWSYYGDPLHVGYSIKFYSPEGYDAGEIKYAWKSNSVFAGVWNNGKEETCCAPELTFYDYPQVKTINNGKTNCYFYNTNGRLTQVITPSYGTRWDNSLHRQEKFFVCSYISYQYNEKGDVVSQSTSEMLFKKNNRSGQDIIDFLFSNNFTQLLNLSYKDSPQNPPTETIWRYEYDDHGNWIKRERYEVIHGDIDIENLKDITTRKYEYYDAPKETCTNVKVDTDNSQNPSSNSLKTIYSNTQEGNRVVIIDGSELRLRLGPATSYDTFKWPDGTNRHPNVGDRFIYLGESGDFYKIDFNGNELWVSKQFSHIE